MSIQLLWVPIDHLQFFICIVKRLNKINIIFFTQIGHDWGYYTMITDLPKYAHDVLKFNIASTGFLTSLPYFSLWLSSFLFGFVCDYCIRKGYHSIKMGRIIHTSIGKY